jgi:hypothetical protein
MVTSEFSSGVTVLQLHTFISLIIAILICSVAMWRGDKAARWTGAVCLAGWLGSILVYRANAYNADYGVLAVDVASLIGFVWISVRMRRIWTVVLSAFMAIIVASHVAVMIDLRLTLGTLVISMALWSYGVLACIAFGTWAGWRDGRREHA